MQAAKEIVPAVLQVPSSAAGNADTESEQSANPTLLIRNMFECVALSIPIGILLQQQIHST